MLMVYMHDCHVRGLRPKTMKSYEQTLRLFGVWIADRHGIVQVEKIRAAHIRSYISDLQTRGKYTYCARIESLPLNQPLNRRDYSKPVSLVTINGYLRNLRAFFAWAVSEEFLSKSPMHKIKLLPEERQPKEYLDDEEVLCLLKSFDKGHFPEYRDFIATLLMLDSGTRLGETLSVTMEQVDLSDKSLFLPADKTKGRKARVVFFSAKTALEIKRWLQYKDRYCESDYLFPVKNSGAMLQVADFEKNFRKYIKRVGIKKHISPHTLRNNFAKRCLLAGMDIFTLSRILGHSSVKVTEQAYLDVTEQDLKQQYGRFSPVDSIFRKRKR